MHESRDAPKNTRMARQIYVNLPVKDLARTRSFFSSLGFAFEAKFTNENALCMVIGENMFVMFLLESFFRTFTKKELCDATRCTEMLLCLSCDSRQEVDDFVATAVAAGGTIAREPEDHGFMYGHAFQDPDGHIWELLAMDPAVRVEET